MTISRFTLGLMIAGLAVAHATYSSASAQQPTSRDAPVLSTEPRSADLATIRDTLERGVAALAAQNDEAGSAREEKRAADDLSAQQGMERWAFAMFLVATVSTFTGIAGLFFLMRNLRQVNEANRLAELAVLETRDIGEKQNRAFVHVEKCTLEWAGSSATKSKVILTCKNTGSTPAFNVRDVVVTVMPWEPEAWSPAGVPRRAIPPSGKRICPTELEGANHSALFEGWLNDRSPMIVKGHVYYEDVFGRKFRSGFAFIRRRDEGVQFVPYEIDMFPLYEEAPITMQRESIQRLHATRTKLESRNSSR